MHLNQKDILVVDAYSLDPIKNEIISGSAGTPFSTRLLIWYARDVFLSTSPISATRKRKDSRPFASENVSGPIVASCSKTCGISFEHFFGLGIWFMAWEIEFDCNIVLGRMDSMSVVWTFGWLNNLLRFLLEFHKPDNENLRPFDVRALYSNDNLLGFWSSHSMANRSDQAHGAVFRLKIHKLNP